MSEVIEQYKQQINEAKSCGGDWKTPYEALMKALYEQPVLFFALSKQDYHPENNRSTPLVSTKDFGGRTSLYVFSDVSLASNWMSYYRHVTEDMRFGLIGAIEKNNHGFLSVFQIAAALGIQMLMLDEGGAYIGIDIPTFLQVNEIPAGNVEVPLSKEEVEQMMAHHEAPRIRFASVPAIPLTR